MRAESIDSHGHIAFLRASDGLRLRYGFWPACAAQRTAPLLLLGGRTEYLEKYSEVIGELTSRGHDVYSFDWRGQGLSDRLLADTRKCFVRSYEHYVSDLEQFVGQVVRARSGAPLLALAHSMGAHILLRYLDRGSGGIAGAVLTAPMIDIRTHPLPVGWARRLSGYMVKTGRETWNVPAAHRHNPFITAFKWNRLTSDSGRFRRIQHCVLHDPRLSAADVTYGWLAATFASIDRLHRRSFGSGIKVPLLMVLSGRDRVVSNTAARRLAVRLPELKLAIIDDARHEILQERDELRKQFWDRFDCFAAPYQATR